MRAEGEGRGGARGQRPVRRQRRRLSAARVHPVRGREDRCPPPHRRRPRARRAARAARRAPRPLRPAAGARREPDRAPAGPDRARAPGRAGRRVPRRSPVDHAPGAGRGRGGRRARAHAARRSTSPGRRRWAFGWPTSPLRASPRCRELTAASGRGARAGRRGIDRRLKSFPLGFRARAGSSGKRKIVAVVLGAGARRRPRGVRDLRRPGAPSIPDGAVAIVEEAPDGTITQEEFDRNLLQAAFNLQLRTLPAGGRSSVRAGPAVGALELDPDTVGQGRGRGAGHRGLRPRHRAVPREIINEQLGGAEGLRAVPRALRGRRRARLRRGRRPAPWPS